MTLALSAGATVRGGRAPGQPRRRARRDEARHRDGRARASCATRSAAAQSAAPRASSPRLRRARLAVGRVLSRDELVRQIAADRAAGRTIAFANGCFDLLHVGHVRYLQAAAAEADRLVVAINDDRSVAGAEGTRPADPLRADRAELVAALRGVDYVVDLPRADGDAAAARAEARRALQGDRLHRRHRARARDRPRLRRPHRHRRRSQGSLDPRLCSSDARSAAKRAEGGRAGCRSPNDELLIVRLGALGDVVHAIPAAAALRRAFPAARIDWLVDAKHRDIVDLVTVVDRVVTARQPDARRLDRPRCSALRQTAYDIAIDLQGLLKSAVLARASGAARVVGFSIWHLREKTARPFYSDVHEAETAHVIAQESPAAAGDRRPGRRDRVSARRRGVARARRAARAHSGRSSVCADQPGCGVAEQALAGRALRRGRRRSCAMRAA